MKKLITNLKRIASLVLSGLASVSSSSRTATTKLFTSGMLLLAITLSSFNSIGQCPVDPNVYLTNIAFVADADCLLTGFDLPLTMNYNSTNPNNFCDINTPIRFKIKCFNNKANGTSIVSGQCRIRTTDPNVHLLDSTAGLNNVAYGTEAWSIDEFEILIDPAVTTSYTAVINFVVVENSSQWTTPCIQIPIMPYTLASFTMDDDNNPDSHGNSNNIANPGEAVETLPILNNTSIFDATYMLGEFFNYQDWYGLSVWNNQPGSAGTVYDNGWWNFSFGSPQPIPAGSLNMSPEYDFVYDYNYTSTYSFDMVVATYSGFYIFGPGNNPAYLPASVKIDMNPGFPPIPLIPAVTTTAAGSITVTSASSGGNVTSIGEDVLSQRGVCYSTSANPTIANSVVNTGTGIGSYVSNITGLTSHTTYHVRAFATNGYGTAYGNDITFTTLTAGISEESIASLVNVYPNPFNNDFFIKVDTKLINEKYNIKNIIGECVAKGVITNETTKISLGNFSKGISFLTFDGISKQAIKIVKN